MDEIYDSNRWDVRDWNYHKEHISKKYIGNVKFDKTI